MTNHGDARRGPRRIRYLDGIRGIAILAVLGVHWGTQVGGQAPGGYIGVDIFFVLSGYVITSVLIRNSMSYATFITKRAKRLLPALGGLLVGGMLLSLLPISRVEPLDALWSALLAAIQGGSIDRSLGGMMTPFGITWSLAAEWYFYLAWPLAIAAALRLRAHQAAAALIAAAAMLYAVALVLPGLWFYYGPVSRSAELVLGAAVAFQLSQEPASGNRRRAPSIVLIVVACLLGAWVMAGPGYLSFAYRLGAFPVTAVFTAALIVHGHNRQASSTIVLRVLSCRPLSGLGLVSYSLYLWHALPIELLPQQHGFADRSMQAAIGIALVVIATTISFVKLERPFTSGQSRSLGGRAEAVPVGRRIDLTTTAAERRDA